MKKYQAFLMLPAVIAALVCMGCGPVGGTITLVNQSSYPLAANYISLGESTEDSLYPGQWMKASIEKDIFGASVHFKVSGAPKQDGELIASGANAVVVDGSGGSWGSGLFKEVWTSSLISVNGGESIVITVRNKPAE